MGKEKNINLPTQPIIVKYTKSLFFIIIIFLFYKFIPDRPQCYIFYDSCCTFSVVVVVNLFAHLIAAHRLSHGPDGCRPVAGVLTGPLTVFARAGRPRQQRHARRRLQLAVLRSRLVFHLFVRTLYVSAKNDFAFTAIQRTTGRI